MASYLVELTKSAEKDLRKIDKRYIPRITQAIDSLASNPRPIGSKKLVGTDHTYRIRVGDYRVLYEIEDECLLILVFKIRHRQSSYN